MSGEGSKTNINFDLIAQNFTKEYFPNGILNIFSQKEIPEHEPNVCLVFNCPKYFFRKYGSTEVLEKLKATNNIINTSSNSISIDNELASFINNESQNEIIINDATNKEVIDKHIQNTINNTLNYENLIKVVFKKLVFYSIKLFN